MLGLPSICTKSLSYYLGLLIWLLEFTDLVVRANLTVQRFIKSKQPLRTIKEFT